VKRNPLPIDAVLPDIVNALRRHNALVISAPTGAGKTTRVPPAILDGGLAENGQIILLEPRRLAARAAARRMADERGGRLGDEIGYHVRFDRRCGPKTRILVVTEGLLVRLLQSDPFLEKVNTVVFDEFHERGLETDLALGMVRLIQKTVRPDLRIVVMSATFATGPVAAYLGDCPIVSSEGRLYPVDILYEPRPAQLSWPRAAAAAVKSLLTRTSGDVLVFLPGLREIRQTAEYLKELAHEGDLLVVPLHGDLPAEEQDVALLPQSLRKIVLATNVAETSVTVEGITGIVDTGLARMLIFDQKTGLDKLELTPISKASADQRTGRAGRICPGICLRLWSETGHRARPEQTEPEIRRVDLAGPLLQIMAMGERGVDTFPWFEPPPQAHLTRALELLKRLGAIEDRGITDLGRTLADLPVHPRLGCLLMEGNRWGQIEKAAMAAALLSERDPFSRNSGEKIKQPTLSDVLDRIETLEEFERRGHRVTPLGTLNPGAARFLLHARSQFLRLFKTSSARSPKRELVAPEEALLRSLLAAFPDRVARRREPGSRKGIMVGGRGVKLAPSSGVTEPELFLCIEADAGQSETLVWQASAIERDWLPSEKLRIAHQISFDPESEKVSARKQILYEDLVLQDNPAAIQDESQMSLVLLAAAHEHWDRVVPSEDSSVTQYLTRLRCLRAWMPELNLPAFEEEDLKKLLPEICIGCKSFANIRNAPWIHLLQNRLTSRERLAVDREAPVSLVVPSGSRLILDYEENRPPILAVRIQEIFGWRETPRVAGGRVPVLLHLLAPSNRPQQITDDLASFWANTYPRIRKELRIRYPKHSWPENPLSASPERRPKRKG